MHIYFLYNIFLLQIYWGLVEFGNFPEHKFDLPFVKGPEPKFLLDKIIYQEIDFEKLQSTYMSLVSAIKS